MSATFVVAAVAAALALSACGSTVSLDPVAKAATETAGKGSEHVAFSGNVSVLGQQIQMSGDGDFRTDPELGRMSLMLTGPGVDTTIDEVISGTRVYMRSPVFAKGLPAGKTWVSVDLKKNAKRLGVSLGQFAQSSPTDTIKALKQAGSVTKIGTETIDGVQTTHYRANVDVSKLAQGGQLPPASNVKSIPLDVWIDGDNLLRRLTENVSMTAGGQQVSEAVTMSLSNYGEPVNVQVPDASDTIDMTKLGG